MVSAHKLKMIKQPLETGAMAKYKYDPKLAKKYSFVSPFGDKVKLYESHDDSIYLPRNICPLGATNCMVEGEPCEFPNSIVPRNSEQTRVISEATQLLECGENFLLRAGTGFGKTICCLKVIANIGVKTLVIVPKTDLMDTWKKAIMTFYNIPESEIGILQADKCQVQGKKIVIAMLKSISTPDRYPDWVYDEFGLVVFDEVHRLGAEKFSYACGLFPAKLRLGLSATTKRKDGKSVVFEAHIGPVRVETDLITLSPKVLLYRSNWMCPRVKNKHGEIVKLQHQPGKTMHLTKMLGKHKERNILLANIVKEAYKAKRTLVFFSDTLDHLNLMRKMCINMGVAPSDTGMYVGGMKKHVLEIAKHKPIIFTTFKMMSEGTDIPWLDMLILAMPKADVEQVVGRVLREFPDKKEPVVVDIIDDDSPVFKGYAEKRLIFYRKKQAKIKTMNPNVF